jgi:hypothetical protein
VTSFLDLVLFNLMEMGVAFLINLIPIFLRYYAILFAICWSKPRRKMERTMTVTSRPRPFRIPAHYNAM